VSSAASDFAVVLVQRVSPVMLCPASHIHRLYESRKRYEQVNSMAASVQMQLPIRYDVNP